MSDVDVETKSATSSILNLTPYRIAIRAIGSDQKLVIPAFGKRALRAEEIAKFEIPSWTQANLVEERPQETDKAPPIVEYLKLGFWFYVGIAFAVGMVLQQKIKEEPGPNPNLEWVLAHYFLLALLGSALLFLGFGIWAVIIRKKRGRQVRQGLMQGGLGLLSLVIAIGVPFLAVFWAGKSLRVWESAGYSATLEDLVQFVFISIAAMTPAALFFLFDRQRLRTLRESFFRDVTRLDPQVRSLDDAESIYGARVNEIYGEPDNVGGGRIGGQKRGPVIIATILITAGWLLALRVGRDGSSMNVLDWFRPNLTPMVFGFLGAYFFGLTMLFHRYTRSDLKPKAYSHLTVRILTVCTLCWALPLLPQMFGRVVSASDLSQTTPVWVLVLAFIVGVFPQTGLNLMIEMLRENKRLRKAIPSLHEKQTLDELEGVSLYDRTRLLEEGIENIENLAHHDLIDLVLHTRLPVPRLVDWVDQAILYLHLGIEESRPEVRSQPAIPETNGVNPPGSTPSVWTQRQRTQPAPDGDLLQENIGRRNLRLLREHGIRNATGLERASGVTKNPKDENAKQQPAGEDDVNPLLGLLGQMNGGSPRLAVILRTVAGEQWMPHLRQWRRFGEQKDETRGLERFEQDWKESEEKGKPVELSNRSSRLIPA